MDIALLGLSILTATFSITFFIAFSFMIQDCEIPTTHRGRMLSIIDSLLFFATGSVMRGIWKNFRKEKRAQAYLLVALVFGIVTLLLQFAAFHI